MSSDGPLIEMLDGAAALLAQSETFQDRCQVTSPEDALRRIGSGPIYDPDGLHARRPFARVMVSSAGANHVSEGIGVDLEFGGDVLLYLTDNARFDDESQSYRDFFQFLGSTVFVDMVLANGVSNLLPFFSISIRDTLRTPWTERQSGHDYWETVVLLELERRT